MLVVAAELVLVPLRSLAAVVAAVVSLASSGVQPNSLLPAAVAVAVEVITLQPLTVVQAV